MATTALLEDHPSETKWLPAIDAVHELARALGDRVAKETLLSRLEDGVIRFRAQVLIHEADRGPIYDDPDTWRGLEYRNQFPRQKDRSWVQTADDGRLIEAPEGFFAKHDGWVLDPVGVRWARGTFVARRPAEFSSLKSNFRMTLPGRSLRASPDVERLNASLRRVASGLSFLEADLKSPGPSRGPNSPVPLFPRSPSGDTQRSEYVTMAEIEPALHKIREDFRSGAFGMRHKNLPLKALRSTIRKEIERNLIQAELPVPSRSTLERRAARLSDDYRLLLTRS